MIKNKSIPLIIFMILISFVGMIGIKGEEGDTVTGVDLYDLRTGDYEQGVFRIRIGGSNSINVFSFNNNQIIVKSSSIKYKSIGETKPNQGISCGLIDGYIKLKDKYTSGWERIQDSDDYIFVYESPDHWLDMQQKIWTYFNENKNNLENIDCRNDNVVKVYTKDLPRFENLAVNSNDNDYYIIKATVVLPEHDNVEISLSSFPDNLELPEGTYMTKQNGTEVVESYSLNNSQWIGIENDSKTKNFQIKIPKASVEKNKQYSFELSINGSIVNYTDITLEAYFEEYEYDIDSNSSDICDDENNRENYCPNFGVPILKKVREEKKWTAINPNIDEGSKKIVDVSINEEGIMKLLNDENSKNDGKTNDSSNSNLTTESNSKNDGKTNESNTKDSQDVEVENTGKMAKVTFEIIGSVLAAIGVALIIIKAKKIKEV